MCFFFVGKKIVFGSYGVEEVFFVNEGDFDDGFLVYFFFVYVEFEILGIEIDDG